MQYARFSAVALAWKKVKPETISKCFRKAGVLQDATMDVVARTHDTEDDPFLESDACMELQNLLEKTMPNSEQRCSLAEYMHGEEVVLVRVDMDGEDWDANFIHNLLMVMKVVMKMIWMWMKSLCLSLSEVIKELDEIKLFFKMMDVLEKQVLSPLQWIWLHHFILHL